MKQEAPIVWSRNVRLLHWGLVLCIVVNFINDGDGNKDLHRVTGYVAATMMFMRVLYGFFSRQSHFKHHRFVHWPLKWVQLVDFIKHEISGQSKDYEGHNPAASWTYIGIWSTVLALGVTGFMMGLDAFWGEEWLEEVHEAFTKLMMLLVAIHLSGLLKDAIKFKRKTWNRMIFGRF
jgi:cytochrome b